MTFDKARTVIIISRHVAQFLKHTFWKGEADMGCSIRCSIRHVRRSVRTRAWILGNPSPSTTLQISPALCVSSIVNDQVDPLLYRLCTRHHYLTVKVVSCSQCIN